VALEKRARWTPFYQDIGQILVSPFFGSAWIMFGIMVVFDIFPGIDCFGPPIVAAIQITFYLHVVHAVGEGSYEMPEWPDKDDWVEMLVDLIKVVFVSLVTLIPLIVIGFLVGGGFLSAVLVASRGLGGGSTMALGPVAILFFGLAAIYVLYLPICIAIIAVFRTVLPAFNPILIGRIIFRIGTPYLYAAGLWVAFFIFRFVFSSIAQRITGLNFIAPSIFSVYFTLLNAYVLGRVIYENEEKIGWH